MFEPWVNAKAPIEAASCPTWTRTSEKSAPKNDSIFFWTASGNGWPPARPRLMVSGSWKLVPGPDAWTAACDGRPPGKNPWSTPDREEMRTGAGRFEWDGWGT